MVPVISIVGRSNTGKTMLIEKLLPEIKRRGYRVATIKHAAHRFEIDKPGKDSYRHYLAGADAVMISSKEKVALLKRNLGQEISLNQLIKQLPPVDLVLTEGYKKGDKPKIEVHRRDLNQILLCSGKELVCVATNESLDIDAPCFHIDDAAGIVDMIEERFLKKKP